MDNQHEKITGYRDLSQAEIDLMNKIKAQGAELQALVAEVRLRLHDCIANPLPHETAPEFAPHRWVSIAATDFQTGLMALTRAVARPSSF